MKRVGVNQHGGEYKSIRNDTKIYGEKLWPGHPDRMDSLNPGYKLPNDWIPKQAIRCMSLKINTHPKFSEKFQEVDNLRKYHDFCNK